MSYNPWIDHLTHPQPHVARDAQVLAARQRRELAKAAGENRVSSKVILPSCDMDNALYKV